MEFLNNSKVSFRPFKTEEQLSVSLQSFHILKCIGVGGFSKVYLVRFKQDGKFYAMKVINKEFIVQNKKKGIIMNERNVMEKLKN